MKTASSSCWTLASSAYPERRMKTRDAQQSWEGKTVAVNSLRSQDSRVGSGTPPNTVSSRYVRRFRQHLVPSAVILRNLLNRSQEEIPESSSGEGAKTLSFLKKLFFKEVPPKSDPRQKWPLTKKTWELLPLTKVTPDKVPLGGKTPENRSPENCYPWLG